MKTLVTGGTGLVGCHLKEIFPQAIYINSCDVDLTDYNKTLDFIRHIKPDIIIHLAARVGGILDNLNFPVDYLEQNIQMNTNILKISHLLNVKKVIAILSTCIYPNKVDNYPMSEEVLFNGPPAESNFSYGFAKRCMAAHINAYNKQYNKNWSYLIPCNLYGEYDKYTEHNSHFVAALIKKIHEADKEIVLWGDGTPLRQFMYAGDLAYIIKYMIENNITGNFNVATDELLTINEMAKIAIKACGKEHLTIKYDNSKPNGQYRKDVDCSKLREVMPNLKFLPLSEGIKFTYDKVKDKSPLFRIIK